MFNSIALVQQMIDMVYDVLRLEKAIEIRVCEKWFFFLNEFSFFWRLGNSSGLCFWGHRGRDVIVISSCSLISCANRNEFYFTIFFPGVWDCILVENRVESGRWLKEGHIAEHSRESIDARLPLSKMAGITPRRSEIEWRTTDIRARLSFEFIRLCIIQTKFSQWSQKFLILFCIPIYKYHPIKIAKKNWTNSKEMKCILESVQDFNTLLDIQSKQKLFS